MDALLLSRIQFGFTAGFHYLYPPLSIGLAVLLVLMEGLHLATGKPIYHQLARFWTRIFALTFAIGVATGLVMEFEFGTNWSAYSRFVGDVFGSPLAAEGLLAFVLESSFLGVLVFGWNRVGKRMHFFSTLMVCLGAHLSAVWIVIANSWMHTPAGYHLVAGPHGPRAEITDFWAMVFNPSAMDRLGHVILGAWLAGAFLVLAISAWYLLKKRHETFAKASLAIALPLALVAALMQFVTGDASAKGVAANQPAKLAAFEGHFDTGPADLYLFGWVDERGEQVRCGVALPGMLSWLVHGDAAKPVTGLNEFAPADRPPVNVVFQCYHAMVAIGVFLIGVTMLAAFLWWHGTLWTNMRVEHRVVHANCNASIKTGHWEYDDLDWSKPPQHPTIFEIVRKHRGLPDTAAWSFVYASILANTGRSSAEGEIRSGSAARMPTRSAVE